MNYDLVMIKEKYGERMMHLCRELFPTLLETDGLLFELLRTNFAYSKFLYNNNVLISLYVPNLKIIGNDFLRSNSVLTVIDLGTLEQYGKYFFCNNLELSKRVLQLM